MHTYLSNSSMVLLLLLLSCSDLEIAEPVVESPNLGNAVAPLLARIADVDAEEKHEETVLHRAARHDRAETTPHKPDIVAEPVVSSESGNRALVDGYITPLDFEYVKQNIKNINPKHIVKTRNGRSKVKTYSNCLSCSFLTWRWLHNSLPDIPKAKREMAREPNALIYNDSMHLTDSTRNEALNYKELLNLVDDENHVVNELESDSVRPVFKKSTLDGIKQCLLSLPLNRNNALAGILYQESMSDDNEGTSGHFTNFYRIGDKIMFIDAQNDQISDNILSLTYRQEVYYYHRLEGVQETNMPIKNETKVD